MKTRAMQNKINSFKFIELLKQYAEAYDKVTELQEEDALLARYQKNLDITLSAAEAEVAKLNDLICTDKENQHVYILGTTVFVVGPAFTDVYRGTFIAEPDQQEPEVWRSSILDTSIYTSELAHTTSDAPDTKDKKKKIIMPLGQYGSPEVFSNETETQQSEESEAVISEDEAAPSQTESLDIKEEISTARRTGWFGGLGK
jgi:hypothetical protein